MRLLLTFFYIVFIIFGQSCQKKTELKPNIITEEKALTKAIDSILAVQANYPDSALSLFKKGLQICEDKKFDEGINRYYEFIVFNLCIYQNNFEEGYTTAKKYLNFAENNNNTHFLIDAYSTVALTFAARDLTDSAAYYYLYAIDNAKKNNDTVSLYGIYRNIIQVYLVKGDYKKALQYSLINLVQATQKKDTEDLASIHNNISIVYKALNDIPNWKKHIDDAYSFLNYTQDPTLKLEIMSGKSAYLMHSNQYDSALYFYLQTENLSQKIQDSFNLAQAQINKAYCKLKMKNTNAAVFDLRIAEATLQNLTIPLEKAKAFEQIKFEIFKTAGKINQAIVAKEKYSILADSLYTINASKIYTETESQIKEANFDKNISEKKIMINKRNYVILVLSTLIISLSFIGYLFYKNQLKKKLLQEKNIELLKSANQSAATNARLEAQLSERSRISREIHDELGASLTSIALSTDLLKSKLKNHDVEIDKISTTSSAMVDSLNEIIWSLNSGNDSFKSLIAYTRKMFNNLLEDTTIKHEFSALNINQDYMISGTARRAIYLTTKEALNNAIKHSKARNITLVFSIKNHIAEINLADDGIGIQEKNEFGNGLINMKTTIENIGGVFLILNNKGTTIHIKYPLKNNDYE
jgi:signal transduction histidine kinase